MTSDDIKTGTIHPSELVAAVSEGRALAFIGSRFGFVGGGPTWHELLLGLAHDAERNVPDRRDRVAAAALDVQHGRTLDALEALEDALGPLAPRLVARQMTHGSPVFVDVGFAETVAAGGGDPESDVLTRRGKLESRFIWPTRAHRILARMGFRAMIATGWDRAMDRAAADSRTPTPVITRSYGQVDIWLGRRRVLVKLFGDIENHVDLVCSRERAGEVADDTAFAGLAQMVRESTPLFIGYGADDPDTQLLFEAVLPRWKAGAGFAICHDTETAERFAALGHQAVVLPDEDLDSGIGGLAEAAGLQLLFTVYAHKQVANVAEAIREAMPLALQLSGFEGPVAFTAARVDGDRIEVDLTTDAGVLRRLTERLESQDVALRATLGRHRVQVFDWAEVRWTFTPLTGDFR